MTLHTVTDNGPNWLVKPPGFLTQFEKDKLFEESFKQDPSKTLAPRKRPHTYDENRRGGPGQITSTIPSPPAKRRKIEINTGAPIARPESTQSLANEFKTDRILKDKKRIEKGHFQYQVTFEGYGESITRWMWAHDVGDEQIKKFWSPVEMELRGLEQDNESEWCKSVEVISSLCQSASHKLISYRDKSSVLCRG